MERNRRTASGQFAAGNAGGPGRPRRATERAYLTALSDACTPETWREIIDRAVADAKAREWLAGYLVGKPANIAVTVHGIAVEEEAESDPIKLDAGVRRQDDLWKEVRTTRLFRTSPNDSAPHLSATRRRTGIGQRTTSDTGALYTSLSQAGDLGVLVVVVHSAFKWVVRHLRCPR
jgi:hypothetical protein